jgi:hypothetical protein
MRMVKILLSAIGLIGLTFIVAFVIAGVTIPAGQAFDNQIEINAPAETVWQVICDRSRYTDWQSDLAGVESIDERNWVEHPKNSPEPLRFQLREDQRPDSMTIDYSMGDAFTGNWKGEMKESPSGVLLTTRDSYSAKGWISKTMVFLFFDLDKFAKDWNKKLKQRAEGLSR